MRYGGNTTCIQIQIPGTNELLVFDCGTGLRNLGNSLEEKGEALRGRVFITHPHWDHLQGFPFFKPFYEKDNWFRIYLPPQDGIGCREILQGHMSNTFFPVSMDMLEANLECETIEPGKINFENYTIEYMWATHTVPTAIFKILIGDIVIVFAPDNELSDHYSETDAFITEFRNFINEADILIHDAQYDRNQYQSKKGWGHTAWETITEIARQEKVKKLFLFHHDPDNSDDKLDAIQEKLTTNFAEDFDSIALAKEGQVINLPYVAKNKSMAD
jgi:phosphoribosyl 1,2-cyclic phosphodiesterase